MELNAFASIALYLTVFLSATMLMRAGLKSNHKTLIILAILLPVLLAGFRYSAGTDSLTYRHFYSDIGSDDPSFIRTRIVSGGSEPFIIIVALIGNLLHLPASFLFIVFALIITISFYIAAKMLDKKRAWLYYGMLLFIVFPEGFNMMRQLAAISVQIVAFMYIINCLKNKKKISLLLTIFLLLFSISIHYSSVILLPVFILPFMVKYIRGRSLMMLFSILAFVCIFAFKTALEIITKTGLLPQKHYETLLQYDGSLINVSFAITVVLSGILLANYWRNKNVNEKQLGFLMLAGVSYSAIGFYSGYLGRIAVFFWVFGIAILGNIIDQCFEKKSQRNAVNLVVAIGYFVLYYCVLGFNELIPYSFSL